MAKKLVAVTAIKHNGETFDAGTTLDASQFTREVLTQLHDNGAIVISDASESDSESNAVQASDLTPAELGQQGAQTQDVSAAAKESTAATVNAAKAAPAKK